MHTDIDIKTTEAQSAPFKKSQNEFAVLTKVSRKKLQVMATKEIFVPYRDNNGKTSPCYYTEWHLSKLPDALQEYEALKQANRKKPTDNSESLFDVISPQDTIFVSETDGSEDDREVDEISAIIPTDTDDKDDELIDTPIEAAAADNADSHYQGEDHTVKFLLSQDSAAGGNSDSGANVTATTGINLVNASYYDVEAATPDSDSDDTRKVDAALAHKQAPVSKKFLPMTITPNFDAIPAQMKTLKRWICWQLQPKRPQDKKDRKVPMTPKNGRLVNASVTDSNNWLTFDEALSWYKRGECTGIGFCLTNTPPKVCCVDVDHCFDDDGSLSDKAVAVMDACQNSWTEKSQSATGLHIWFVDDDFDGGRRKDNVEVYAADRYIALTGCRVQSSSEELLTVNGACKAVIAKFIDANADTGDNLFDKSARADEIQIPADGKLTAEIFDNNAPMDDSDRQLVDYFHSDKCRERDPNMFYLFSGNLAEYFKNTGKTSDLSVADNALLTKILYYVGGVGTDKDISQRALTIFNQSELAKRGKWIDREDYRLRTLKAAFKFWIESGRKAHQSETFTDDAAQIDSLKADLRAVMKAIADFDNEETAALEFLRSIETFDSDTVFSDDVLTAAAFARISDRQAFSTFKREVKIYGDKHKETKASVNDWLADVKGKAEEIKTRYSDLLTRRNQIQAKIDSLSFVTASDALKNFSIPTNYAISADGIERVTGESMILVCRRPVIITGKVFYTEEKIYKLKLAYMTKRGKWKSLQATESATVFDRNKIVKLANENLPVTSSLAPEIVDWLDAFAAENEDNFPLSYAVNRCGWYTFNGTTHFVDPRRPCVFNDDEDRTISVKVDSRSHFANALRTVGNIDEWKHAYHLAKKSPIARLVVAASVAAPLLKILDERNFLLYIFAPTRAGKTTALYLGASAVGSEKIIRSFDATKNGLVGAAADVNDFTFLVDEKQVADNRISEQFGNLIYSLGNGVGRTKLNQDSVLKKLQDWRTIAVMTGETKLLPDNVTGGANTRLLTIPAQNEILSANTCGKIRHIIKRNFGLAFPLVVDKIFEYGFDKLREVYEALSEIFADEYKNVLPEYCRYLAVLTLADTLLNSVLFGNNITTDDGRTIKPIDDAVLNAKEIFKLAPTTDEISDTPREKAFVRDFIAQNQNRFVGGNIDLERMQAFYGKLNDDDGYTYITAKALRDECKTAGFDYRKLVADLVADGFFAPNERIKKKRRTPTPTVQKKIGKVNSDCYRIPQKVFNSNE